MISFQYPELLGLILVLTLLLFIAYRTGSDHTRNIMLGHFFAGAALVIALSSPYIVENSTIEEQPRVVVLDDQSPSSQLMQKPELDLEGIEADKNIVSTGNSTDLESGFVRNLEPNTQYLVMSDMQAESTEKITQEYSKVNSTLNFLKTEMDQDTSVTVSGPDSTVVGASNQFTVQVHSTTDNTPEPEVTVNGQTVRLKEQDSGVWSFSYSFDSEGDQRVYAGIEHQDENPQNNEFFKSVYVQEKPQLLSIGDEGDLEEELGEFYDIENRNSLPSDLSDYYSVIMKQDTEITPELTEYIIEGNGLVYTGNYDSDINPVLPVRESDQDSDSEGAQIVFAIDSSIIAADCPTKVCFTEADSEDVGEVTGETTNQALRIAYSLISDLPYNNRVGAIAYRQEAYQIDRPKMLAENRDYLLQELEKIRPEGNALHHNGLQGAREILEEGDEGNIILISDANRNEYNTNANTFEQAEDLASNTDAQIITVGVGDNPNEEFLSKVAENGGGFYLDASDSGRLNFMFEAGGAADETVPLINVNPNHFITDGLELRSTATNFNQVKPRRGADLLVTGTNGNPFLTTWNYGLGRVAAFSAGDSDLSEIMSYDPMLASRSVSWTVGDPNRKQDDWIEIDSGRIGEVVEARSSNNIEGFRRQGPDLYVKEIEPNSTGFNQINGRTYSYNYNEELEKIGYNQEIEQFATDTGGNVYTPADQEQIVEDLQEDSQREVETRRNLAPYFLMLGMIILLGEIGYRKRSGRK